MHRGASTRVILAQFTLCFFPFSVSLLSAVSAGTAGSKLPVTSSTIRQARFLYMCITSIRKSRIILK